MATRSIIKLFSKTYKQIPCSPTIPALSHRCSKTTSTKHNRSFSNSPDRVRHTKKFFQARKVSRSLQNLREHRDEHEEEETHEVEEDDSPNTMRLTNMTAREVKKTDLVEEYVEETTTPIYEVTDGYRSTENVHDVLNYMRMMEKRRASSMFAHLQPGNIKPYGSNEGLSFPEVHKKNHKVVFPVTSGRSDEVSRSEEVLDVQDPTNVKRLKVSESKSNYDINTKRYSTSYLTARKITTKASNKEVSTPKLCLRSHLLKKSNSFFFGRKKRGKREIAQINRKASTHNDCEEAAAKSRKSRENFIKCDSEKRLYNTSIGSSETNPNCEGYITVKLGELQEECRKSKKCKPKKLTFGKLPKVKPGDCPCVEEPAMKPGKPLLRLKRRPVEAKPNLCIDKKACLVESRADFGYVIKPKKLRPIVPIDCPCMEPVLDEGTPLKRLVPKPVKEPPRICDYVCPLAVARRQEPPVERKKLPPLKPGECPCIELQPPEDVAPLKKLKPRPVKEFKPVCVKDECPPRADEGMVVKPKKLPEIKPGDCPCLETVLEDVPPLKRLVPKPVKEPPRVCDYVCPLAVRKLEPVVKKKLPPLKPSDCPCVELEPPLPTPPLKKLKKRPVEEKKKVCCPEETCCESSRADHKLKVQAKKLPKLVPGDCPCMDPVLEDVPPLKRLVAKPVKEPPRVCNFVCPLEEARKQEPPVERKKLPVLKPADCPCVEMEPPLPTPPLKKLKKRPVKEKKKVCCPEDKCCESDRADHNLKVQSKKLPKLEPMDCPCLEAQPPEDVKPLARPKKKHVPEPPRVCPSDDICLETPRADEDDWMYWKRVEVNCEPEKTTKRCFSTLATRRGQRCYSTDVQPYLDDVFKIKYDVLDVDQYSNRDQEYNVIIDIKPSAPLILTQAPVEEKSLMDCVSLRRCKSEPVDCVTFVIYQNNNELKCTQSKSGLVKDPPESSTFFNTINRFISTCSTLSLKKGDELQPKKPFLAEREQFIEPFPTDEEIEKSKKKGRMYYRTRRDVMEDEDCDEEMKECAESAPSECVEPATQLTWWQKIVNYFKARPCPSPEEFKQMRLREAAEKAAEKAGLCVYDPKDVKNMPKVITAATVKEEEMKK